jgi:hypothetical protein
MRDLHVLLNLVEKDTFEDAPHHYYGCQVSPCTKASLRLRPSRRQDFSEGGIRHETSEVGCVFQGDILGSRYARCGSALPNLWVNANNGEFETLNLKYLVQMVCHLACQSGIAAVFLR